MEGKGEGTMGGERKLEREGGREKGRREEVRKGEEGRNGLMIA